jgi:hypothetical protein
MNAAATHPCATAKNEYVEMPTRCTINGASLEKHFFVERIYAGGARGTLGVRAASKSGEDLSPATNLATVTGAKSAPCAAGCGIAA